MENIIQILKVQKLNNNAKLPNKTHMSDAGIDLFANENVVLYPENTLLVSTGIAMEIPEGYCGIIKDRSSMGAKGVFTLGGVIDSSYRGEIKIIMGTKDTYVVNRGDKIAQMLLVPVPSVEIVEVESLSETERGSGGFGSTGNK